MQDGEHLRDLATDVLDRLNATPPARPTFIEFSGSAKSGKSTCIDIVAHFFRRLGFRVLAPTEGASKRTPYYLKEDLPAFNTWSACYAVTHVLEGLYHSDKYQIAILDRGLFDALVWFDLLAAQSQISPDDCERVQNFLLTDKLRSVIDIVFLFKADPQTSLERETQDKLISDTGRAMNLDFLQNLNDAYDRVQQQHSKHFPNFEIIDTSKSAATTPKSTAYQVVDRILHLLEV